MKEVVEEEEKEKNRERRRRGEEKEKRKENGGDIPVNTHSAALHTGGRRSPIPVR